MRTWIAEWSSAAGLAPARAGGEKLDGGMDTLHHWSDDLLAAPWDTLALLDECLRDGGGGRDRSRSGSPCHEAVAPIPSHLNRAGCLGDGHPHLRGAVARHLAAAGSRSARATRC